MRQKTRNAGRRGSPAAHPPGRSPSISGEDYLERINELMERHGQARVVDIAASLRVSQPSVSAMVRRLAELGFLHYTRYRGVVMTDRGRAVAEGIRSRHAILQRFLSLLGVDGVTQEQDIEGLEHCLSEATLRGLADLTDFMESHPETVRQFERAKNGFRGRGGQTTRRAR